MCTSSSKVQLLVKIVFLFFSIDNLLLKTKQSLSKRQLQRTSHAPISHLKTIGLETSDGKLLRINFKRNTHQGLSSIERLDKHLIEETCVTIFIWNSVENLQSTSTLGLDCHSTSLTHSRYGNSGKLLSSGLKHCYGPKRKPKEKYPQDL